MEQLTHRQRLLRTLRFQPVDRVPDFEFGAWPHTLRRWIQEGMQIQRVAYDGPLEEYFGTDDTEFGPGLGIHVVALPDFEEAVLEEHGRYQILLDSTGAICEQIKPQPGEYGGSMPRFLRYAIETRADWERLRDERLDPDRPDRIPAHIDALARRLRQADYPITVFMGGLYCYIRNWMGVERLSLAIYDDRPWIEEMMEHLTRLTLTVLGKLAGKGLHIDQGTWWEDMCYNHGALISPRLFADMMLPRYRRITEFMRREFDTEFHMVDCDGNIHELVPLWLEAGINVMFPNEAAHTDPYRIDRELGRRIPSRGSFDKLALIAGPAAIDAEFARLRPLLDRGGFIPHTDHRVPPDVSFANYLYYRRRKCEFIGKPWREPGIQHRPGHLTGWRLLGPLDTQSNPDESTLRSWDAQNDSMPTGPGGSGVRWQSFQSAALSGYVDLASLWHGTQDGVAYAACSLHSPAARDGWLEMGSDGAMQVWLNGEEVWSKEARREAQPCQDLAPVHLRPGHNTILLKVGQGTEKWGFFFRVTDEQGQIWPELQAQI
jgi:uroporphyrinogen decarboxylase